MALSVWVVIGSAMGGLARFWLAIAVAALTGPAFPWGTLLINVVGSLVIGAVGAATSADEHAAWRAFLMVGVCGGFTTFSSYSLQTLELLQAGRAGAALGYAGGSVLACLLAVWLGWNFGKVQWS